MDKSIIIRDVIVDKLKSCLFGTAASLAVKLNGNYFSGADIVYSDCKDTTEVYRIVVIKHNPQKSFT